MINFSTFSELQDPQLPTSALRSALASMPEIIAKADKTMVAFEMAFKAAQSDITVLLLGETGVGKEVFAKFIYQNSRRSDKNFVALNCAALPPELINSELFGYDEGAFTGAKKLGKKGLFELAHEGTIYLDEIGDAPFDVQVRLLRVLQERKLRHVGGDHDIQVDVRVIAASNQDLEKMVEKGQFRRDLFYRLNVIPIWIAPLRERKSDIPLLVERFLMEFNNKYKQHKFFSKLSLQALLNYDWPGNIRELRNFIERAAIICTSDEIIVENIVTPTAFKRQVPQTSRIPQLNEGQADGKMDLRKILEDFEYQAITEAYQRFGSVRKAADYLCMDTSTLVRKRQKYESQHNNSRGSPRYNLNGDIH